MEECLITDVVCSNENKKCKVCPLDDCRRTQEMLDRQEINIRKEEENRIRKQLPKECKDCCFWEIRDGVAYCFYSKKDGCMLK